MCAVECGSIIKAVFLHKFKNCNRMIGKADESLRRKATGPVKWQPVTGNDVHCLFDSLKLTPLLCDVSFFLFILN